MKIEHSFEVYGLEWKGRTYCVEGEVVAEIEPEDPGDYWTPGYGASADGIEVTDISRVDGERKLHLTNYSFKQLSKVIVEYFESDKGQSELIEAFEKWCESEEVERQISNMESRDEYF